MQEDSISHQDDPSIPVLTEVLDAPLAPAPQAALPAAAQPQPAAPTDERPQAAPVGEPHPLPIADDASLDWLRVAVLKDLQVRLDPLLQTRMREHVETAVNQALADLVDGLQIEVARMVEEALQKELIRVAAQQEQLRGRPRDEVTGD